MPQHSAQATPIDWERFTTHGFALIVAYDPELSVVMTTFAFSRIIKSIFILTWVLCIVDHFFTGPRYIEGVAQIITTSKILVERQFIGTLYYCTTASRDVRVFARIVCLAGRLTGLCTGRWIFAD
jgi:hypothetical protein